MKNMTITFKKKRIALALTSVLAISASMQSLGGEPGRIHLSIESQPVGNALMELGKAAGVQIVVPMSLGASIDASGLEGEYTLQDALDAMLMHSGLSYEFLSDNTIRIKEKEKVKSEGELAGNDLEEIVVTGSALRKKDLSAPLQIYTREDLEARGIFSAAAFVRSLPQNTSSLNVTTSTNEDPAGDTASFVPQAGMPLAGLQGASAANLRGLGMSGTLVLVNGRRQARSPVLDNGYVDLNGISFNEIDRIEVLLDGASARYGADAVGGVINFILLKSQGAGAKTDVRYEHGQNGGSNYNLSQSFHYSWDSGRARLGLTASETRPISSEKVGWTSKDLRPLGGGDQREAGNQPGAAFSHYENPFPWAPWVRFPVYTALPSDHNGVGATPDEFTVENARTNSELNKHLSVSRESINIRLDAEQELGFWNGVAWFDATYAKNTTKNESLAHEIWDYRLPASNAFNPFGEEKRVRYQFNQESRDGLIEQVSPININRMYSFSTGLTFDLPFNDWKLDLTGRKSEHSVSSESTRLDLTRCNRDPETGRERGLYYHIDDVNFSGEGRPTRSTSQGYVVFECEAGQETTFQQMLISSDPDTALNLIGNGTHQAENISDLVIPVFLSNPLTYDYGVEAIAEGEIYTLPAGGIRMAAGLAYDAQVTDYSEAQSSSYYRGLGDYTADNEKIHTLTKSAFLETSIPLVSEENSLPGVQFLELGLQARYTHIEIPESTANSNTEWSQTTPKFTVAWSPIDDLIIRGTWSESFKAPSNTVVTGRAPEFDDPADCIPSATNECRFPWEHGGQPWTYVDVDGYTDENGNFLEGPQTVEVWTTSVGSNPTIRPEMGVNKTIGFDWLPEFIDGLAVRATYSIADYKDKIMRLDYRRYEPEVWMLNPALYWEDENDKLKFIRNIPSNVASYKTSTIDGSVEYLFSTDIGDFAASLRGSYTRSLTSQVFKSVPEEDTVGTRWGPDRFAGVATLGWMKDEWALNLTANYKSNYTWSYRGRKLDDYDNFEDKVEGYLTFDLTGSYEMVENGLKFSFGVRDITNSDFPFINSLDGRPFDGRRVNVQGRTSYVSVSKNFEF